MHGTTVNIIETQQAKLCTTYKNTKLKLLKVNAAINLEEYMVLNMKMGNGKVGRIEN
jgi:hypothetical protein